jgi:hypothetical protein
LPIKPYWCIFPVNRSIIPQRILMDAQNASWTIRRRFPPHPCLVSSIVQCRDVPGPPFFHRDHQDESRGQRDTNEEREKK